MIELGQMKNKKTIEQLEKELEDLKASHRSQWDTYGSELCAGDMIRQEEELEKQIRKAKVEKLTILKGYEPLEPSDKPVVKTKTIKPVSGIEQLREVREETINRWKKSGILDGLTAGIPENLAKMFEPNPIQRINEDDNSYCTDKISLKVYTREQIISILDEFAFFLSDNGDPDTTGKKWFDMQYPEEQIISSKE